MQFFVNSHDIEDLRERIANRLIQKRLTEYVPDAVKAGFKIKIHERSLIIVMRERDHELYRGRNERDVRWICAIIELMKDLNEKG